MGAVLATLGLSLLLVAGIIALRRVRPVWGWLPTRAEVIGCESALTERAVGRLTVYGRVYFFRYRFRDAAGREHEFTSPEASPIWWPEAVGVVLPIRYNPADPGQAVVREFWMVWLLPLALNSASVLLLAACWFW